MIQHMGGGGEGDSYQVTHTGHARHNDTVTRSMSLTVGDFEYHTMSLRVAHTGHTCYGRRGTLTPDCPPHLSPSAYKQDTPGSSCVWPRGNQTLSIWQEPGQ